MTASAIKESTGAGIYRYAMVIYLDGVSLNEIVVPKIPDQILTDHPLLGTHEFEFNRLVYHDYSDFNNLDDFIEERYVKGGANLGSSKLYKEKWIYQNAAN